MSRRHTYQWFGAQPWQCILDVGCNGIGDLSDKSVYARTQIGGITGISDYNGEAIQLLGQDGSKPRWLLNSTIFPLKIEFDIKLLSIRGHGWICEFRNDTDTEWLLGLGLSYQAGNTFCYNSNKTKMVHTPSVSLNKWVHVMILLDIDGCYLHYDGVLVDSNTTIIPPAVCDNFSIRYYNDDSNNNANAAIKNIKLYTALN